MSQTDWIFQNGMISILWCPNPIFVSPFRGLFLTPKPFLDPNDFFSQANSNGKPICQRKNSILQGKPFFKQYDLVQLSGFCLLPVCIPHWTKTRDIFATCFGSEKKGYLNLKMPWKKHHTLQLYHMIILRFEEAKEVNDSTICRKFYEQKISGDIFGWDPMLFDQLVPPGTFEEINFPIFDVFFRGKPLVICWNLSKWNK